MLHPSYPKFSDPNNVRCMLQIMYLRYEVLMPDNCGPLGWLCGLDATQRLHRLQVIKFLIFSLTPTLPSVPSTLQCQVQDTCVQNTHRELHRNLWRGRIWCTSHAEYKNLTQRKSRAFLWSSGPQFPFAITKHPRASPAFPTGGWQMTVGTRWGCHRRLSRAKLSPVLACPGSLVAFGWHFRVLLTVSVFHSSEHTS
jgi:hypothetical protein